MSIYGAVDLGGTFIKCGIVDGKGNILVKGKVPTGRERPYEEIVRDMAHLLQDLAQKANLSIDDFEAVGVGAPGTVNSANGVIVYSNNIAWENIPLGAQLEKELGKKVFVTNDANAAALGESFCGASKKFPSSILVTLGTGVGGGIVLDGKLFEGKNSAGAEIGHITVRAKGKPCTCGRRGCLEAYASASALERRTQEAIEKNPESRLAQIAKEEGGVSGKTVFDGLRSGDKTAQRVFKGYCDDLSEGLISLANVFRPDAIVIGGGISAEGETLLKPLRRRLNKYIYGGNKTATVKLVVATLGNDAGLVGAGCYAMQRKG